ncbi:PSP1 C-terminal domain-containing protein [Roseimaritima sediminicola]|uniref:PSP1 C-terminal domain-containing protein n=1 Tax=Roseimaritima sediminicola TaxID=2662066 RepID=UPI001386F90C|nr:PSP1 C-terminal domain-containing protein [Roseimaritima sediminicola]
MSEHYLIRVGSFGTLFRCQSQDATVYARGQRVVCRTPRGTEIGSVRSVVPATDQAEGQVMRRTTTEDELLVDRLEKHRARAVHRCQQFLAESDTPATLLEVDPLFDGRTLIFFFLGEVDERVQRMTDELVAEYERNVRSRHFAKLLNQGCGPGCGTDAKAGGGCSGGCAVCVVAAACKPASSP